MSTHQKDPKVAALKIGQKSGSYKDILDFGDSDETQKAPELQLDVNSRLKKLVKQLQEINRRIDHLNHRY